MDKNRKEKSYLLEKLKEKMRNDKSLPLKGSANLVFGKGNPDAEILFIGEAPGFWEDQKGEPFVGNAGALLNQLLSSIGIERKNVYITNVVHYRPPGNRDPLPEEIKAFEPYSDEIIRIIDPKVVVTLGRFSMGKFLPGARITSIHGRKYELNWKGKPLTVFPMYHPAAGLRSDQIKRQLFEDFKKLKKILEDQAKKEEVKKKNVEQMSLV